MENKIDTLDAILLNNDDSKSILKKYGENLTLNNYITDPAIGREKEINEVILTLITPEKGAMLVGKPGIGKTAIVEGLAYRIQHDLVPVVLKEWNIIKINITSILGNTIIDNNIESKIELLINELKACEKTILFIDEIHLLVNRSSTNQSVDFANMLKPALDRGAIKMIGATTTEEYETYILRDRAFLRRFIKTNIEESNEETVIRILMGTYPKYEVKMGIKIGYTKFQKEQIFKFIVEMTKEYNRIYEVASRYPDVSLTIVANAFSYAVFENAKEVKIKHFYKAICNSKNIYPDALKKEIVKFKERFKELLKEENVDFNDI